MPLEVRRVVFPVTLAALIRLLDVRASMVPLTPSMVMCPLEDRNFASPSTSLSSTRPLLDVAWMVAVLGTDTWMLTPRLKPKR